MTTDISHPTLRLLSTAWGRFLCYPDDSVGNALEKGQFWDEHLKPYFGLPVAADAWAIDVGAYIGFHTVYMAKYFLHVYAVEPVMQTVELLQDNLRMNAVRNVTTLAMAGYSRECLLRRPRFTELGWDPHHSSNAPAVPWFPGSSEISDVVPAARLDLFCRRPGPLTLIKIDAQGCDLRVLWGLQTQINRHRPLILLEWEAPLAAHHDDTWRDVENWAARHDYRVQQITEHFQDYVLTPEERS